MGENIPDPVLLNGWKHHLGFLTGIIERSMTEEAIKSLKNELKNIGGSTTDLYTGDLVPVEICQIVLDRLRTGGLLTRKAYFAWVDGTGKSYRTLGLPDQSVWVLRKGYDRKKYVHIHPGRYVPHTIRVKANALKTAIAVITVSRLKGADPMDISHINTVRMDLLGFSPAKHVSPDMELGRLILLFGKTTGAIR